MGNSTKARRLVWMLWVAAGLAAVWTTTLVVNGLGRPSHGFVAHYTASRLLVEGADPAAFYDDRWFEEQVHQFEPEIADIYHANLPTMSLMMVPLAVVDYRTARAVWTFASLAAAGGVMIWIALRLGLTGPWLPGLLGFTFAFQPLQENLFHGQMYVLLLVLLTVAWYGFRSGRDGSLGAAVGAAFVTKTAALMMWPLLLVQRRARAVAWGIGIVVGVMALSFPFLGGGAWRAYVDTARQLPSNPALGVTAYQTVHGFFHHLFVAHPQWNAHPLLDMPQLGTALSWTMFAALLGISLLVAARRGHPDALFAAFVTLGLMLSPVSLDYHYTIALLPIALLVSRLRGRIASWQGLALVAGALLIAADLPYKSERLADGARALFAYPKLYGAVLLWGLALKWAATDIGRERGSAPQGGALTT